MERRNQIVVLRQEGQPWPTIAVAVGLSQSRVRSIYAEAVHTVSRPNSDDALLDNLRQFLAACNRSSRRAYGAWSERIVSPATVENRFGSWTQAVAEVRKVGDRYAVGA